MTPDWTCLKPNDKDQTCNQHNHFSDSCTKCGGSRYLTELIVFENKLKADNAALARLVKSNR